MRKKTKNLIIIILMVLISFNFIFPPTSFANDVSDDNYSDEKNFGISISGIIDLALGFLLYPWKKIFIVPGIVANVILSEIASVGDNTLSIVTLESILFNDLPLTDVNIFSLTKTANDVAVSETISNIRQAVAGWYYAFRNLAIVFSLLMLIYTGIRMAISNIAEKKAKYKQMLINWIISVGLILIIHYFMIFVINANTGLVKLLNPTGVDGTDYMKQLLINAFLPTLVESWGSAILYCILLAITLIFLIVYIKRMLMVCFFIIIAPIIAVTYSIDKNGDRKSQILNSWLKEFCYNVLIQPFHCITYLIFVSTAMKILYEGDGLNFGAAIFAIICVLCIFIGEKMIRIIFGFNKSKSVADKIFTSSMVTSVVNNVKTIKESKEEDDEPEPPEVMPDGTDTEEELSKYKVKLKESKQTETVESGNTNSKNKNTNGKKQKIDSPKTTKTKASSKHGKFETTVRNLGKSYARKVSSVVGYDNYKHKQDVARRKKMPSVQEQFLIASDRYRKSVNPAMTDKQLSRQMEIIMKTPMKDLKTPEDVLYKSWIEHTQKGLTSKGSKDTLEDMREILTSDKKQIKS